MQNRYLIVIEKGSRNYSAFSPDVPGCIATGSTINDTLNQMRSAMEFHIEGLIENGEPLPIAMPLRHFVQKADEMTGEDLIAHVLVRSPEIALA